MLEVTTSNGLSEDNDRSNRNFLLRVLTDLGWPLFWGLTAWVGFYALIHRGVIDHSMIQRYFAGHPVEYVEAAMFFIGLAALIIKSISVLSQFMMISQFRLPPIPEGGQSCSSSADLLDTLADQPAGVRNSHLGRRLHDALDFVRRKGAVDGLDDQLKYLAEMDAVRVHDANGLLRTIVWATPMLGFLGTVIGITLALGGLSPEMLAQSPEDAMKGLLAGLSVAFDTTTMALSLSLVLMFCWFLADQFETQLFAVVDARADSEMVGRFQHLGTHKDPHLASVRQMAETVVQSTENLVQRQAEIWQGTINAVQNQWMHTAGTNLQESLTDAIHQSLQAHAECLQQSEAASDERHVQLFESFQQSIREMAGGLGTQQSEMTRQGELMLQVIQATGEVVQLEQALNANLKTLAGSKNFEDTVMSLAAAIHLLNSRLGSQFEDTPRVELTDPSPQSPGRAA